MRSRSLTYYIIMLYILSDICLDSNPPLCCAGWLTAMQPSSDTKGTLIKQEGSQSHDVVRAHQSTACKAAGVSQNSQDQTLDAVGPLLDHRGSCALPQPALQHACLHHMQLPSNQQAEPAKQRLNSGSAHLQLLHSHAAPARAATALASAAIKQGAGSPTSSSAFCESEVPSLECYICSNQHRSADAVSTSVAAASLQPQECCCDCGYVSKRPSKGVFNQLGSARPASADGDRAVNAAACRPSSADVCKAGKAVVQRASVVGLDGALGSLLSPPLCSAAALTPDTEEQQEAKSPLSQLQQSFWAESGSASSTGLSVLGAGLEAGQGLLNINMVGSGHCPLQSPAEIVHSAAAAHLAHQNAWSNDKGRQLEVSPETSFLQMLDEYQQTDTVLPASPRVQLDHQQQLETLSPTTADMPDAAKHTACQWPQPVDMQRQVRTSVLGSVNASSQPTAVVASTEPIFTEAARNSKAYRGGLAAILGDDSRGGSSVNAAGKPVQQTELCQLGAIIADRSQLMRPRPFAESFSELCGGHVPPDSLPASCSYTALAMSAASHPVTVTASAAADSPTAHVVSCPTAATATDADAGHAVPFPAVPLPDDNPRSCAPQQTEIYSHSAEQPVSPTLPLIAAQSINGRLRGVPAAEPGAMQQQQRLQLYSVHAETEHRDAATDAMPASMETDQRWEVLNTAWAEQRQWSAARRRSCEVDAKWELDESGSISGDSEGSVTTESTLRPSSVGRCRVNSGRHAKVCSTCPPVLWCGG